VKLSVSDTGVGMDDATMAQMFEPFFTTREVGQGTGLGLSIAYGIVEQHGGGVDVRSAPGQGTIVCVYLPATGSASSRALPAPGAANGQGTVLLVEDEAAVRELSQALLESLGYRVRAFSTTTAALHAFSAAPQEYDLVLADLAMPDLTGDELAAKVESLRADVPVLLSTAHPEALHPKRASRSARRHFLRKPFTIAELSEALRKALPPG
jgi:CheY-like chemotaxis protein